MAEKDLCELSNVAVCRRWEREVSFFSSCVNNRICRFSIREEMFGISYILFIKFLLCLDIPKRDLRHDLAWASI